MNVISIVVVLYNKTLSNSQTLISLLNIESGIIDNLYIWNNGPTEIAKDDIFTKLEPLVGNIVLNNDLSNKPLSKLYNLFININHNSDYFVIFDDDSILEPSYLAVLKSLKSKNDINLILPKIIQNGIIHYPFVNLKPIKDGQTLTNQNCRSISSGLIFDKTLVNEFYNKFNQTVFDERFAFYGVDTSFFYRLAKIKQNLTIQCLGEISHSLSRLNKSDEKDNKFRMYERTIDVALCARHYPNWFNYKAFMKFAIKFIIKNRDIFLFYTLIKIYILGKHPRCN